VASLEETTVADTMKTLKTAPIGYENKMHDTLLLPRAGAGVLKDDEGSALAWARATGSHTKDSIGDLRFLDFGVQAGKVRGNDHALHLSGEARFASLGVGSLTGGLGRLAAKAELGTRHAEAGAKALLLEVGYENAEGDAAKMIYGVGGGGGIQWGSDPDGDGHRNYGLRVAFAAGMGLDLGISIEPSTWRFR
jgi:hypothetical protein